MRGSISEDVRGMEARMKKTVSVISNISERALGHVLGSKDHLALFGRRGSIMPDRGTSQTFEYTVEGNAVRLNCTAQGHVLSWKPAIAPETSGDSTHTNDQRCGGQRPAQLETSGGHERPALERASSWTLRGDPLLSAVTTLELVSVSSTLPDVIESSTTDLLVFVRL